MPNLAKNLILLFVMACTTVGCGQGSKSVPIAEPEQKEEIKTKLQEQGGMAPGKRVPPTRGQVQQ
jgi:hypothetical protein